MKKYFLIPICLFLAAFLCTDGAMAIALSISSSPVRMIDGDDDPDNVVKVRILDWYTDYDFGYMVGDKFEQIIPYDSDEGESPFFDGGKIVDFAIREPGTSNFIRASEGTATMVFSGLVDSSQSKNPSIQSDYWQYLTITWNSRNNDLVATIGSGNDGFVPAPVPEPATMLLLGSGLIGLAGVGRKKFRKKTE